MENRSEITQEEKELLLKDISARLPYGVKVQTPVINDEITLTCGDISAYFFNPDNKAFLKPYLRPMKSMTEKESNDLINMRKISKNDSEYIANCTDYLLSHHFDYRGLIPKDLAIEAPEGMYDF